MDKSNVITLSDSHFHRKIANKYQKGKRRFITYPMLIFYKSQGNVLSQKKEMHILFKLHFHNQSLVSFKNIVQSVDLAIQRMYHRTILRYLPIKHTFLERISISPCIKSIFSRIENTTDHQHWKYTQIESQQQRNRLRQNEKGYNSIQNKDRWKYGLTLKYNLPIISSPVNLSLNNMAPFNGSGGLFNTSYQNWTNFNKNVIQHHLDVGMKTANSIASWIYKNPQNLSSGNGTAVSIISAKRRTSMPDIENLIFHNIRAIQQKSIVSNLKLNNSYWKDTQIEPQKQRNRLRQNEKGYHSIQNKDPWKYGITVQYNLPIISSPVNLSLNEIALFNGNRGLFKASYQNWMSINKNVIQHYPDVGTKIASWIYKNPQNLGSGNGTVVSIISAIRRTSIPGNENLIFHNIRAIQQKSIVSNLKVNNSHWKDTQIEPQKQINKLKPNEKGYHSIQNKDPWEYGLTVQYNLPVISSPVNLSLNKIAPFNGSGGLFNTSYQKWTNINKNVIQHRPDVGTKTASWIYTKPQNLGSGNGTVVSLIPAKRRTSIPDNENLIFHNTRDIEQKVEQVENILVETRDAVEEISTPAYSQIDMSTDRQIDLNEISEQVYRLIDEKIKIECERRGIL